MRAFAFLVSVDAARGGRTCADGMVRIEVPATRARSVTRRFVITGTTTRRTRRAWSCHAAARHANIVVIKTDSRRRRLRRPPGEPAAPVVIELNRGASVEEHSRCPRLALTSELRTCRMRSKCSTQRKSSKSKVMQGPGRVVNC